VFQRQLTEAGEQVLSVELVGLETGQTPAIILTAPLGISLDASPTLQIDGTSFASTGWKVCVQQGCIARVEAQDLAEKLRTAAKIVVSFQGPGEPPENIAIDVPIDGLSAGIDRIVQSNQ
jgi:invasion protein IalB